MPATKIPVLKDIVLVGAGHAHVGVLRSFGMDPVPGIRLTLVTRQVHTPYSGMLPGLIAGHYDFDQVHIDTAPLACFAGARLYEAEVTGLDLAGKRVHAAGRPPIRYDALSIDIGSTPGGRDVPGVIEHAVPVKPIDRFLDRYEAARTRILAAGGKSRVGVVGGGPAGVELAFALHTRLRRDIAAAGGDADALAVVVLSAGSILPALPAGARNRVLRVLVERGIEVRVDARVVGIDGRDVTITGGRIERIDEIFWTTQAQPARWLAETGLALDPHGFIAVDATLRSTSHPDVFAAGDIASMQGFDVPKSGVYAVRQGPYLAENLRRLLAARPLRRFRPQRNALYLLSTGDRYAVGVRNGISFAGGWVWRWKDHIDRTFMDRFRKLPEMGSAVGSRPPGLADEAAIRAISQSVTERGGHGADVGATLQSRAFGAIVPAQRPDVLVGLDTPDDVAVVDTGTDRLSVYTVDDVKSVVDDPYTFGRIAANHALGDIYAMGAEPQVAMAMATLPCGIEAKVEADLSDVMTGANEVLREAGCALVAGHAGEGAELALGFAITGRVDRAKDPRKDGLVPGDALILTKPIGTGTLLAADRRGRAKARWVMAAIAHMTQSSRDAARVLERHGVHAMTDVAGLGLLGHLVELVRASVVDATIDLGKLPVLAGARETLAAGMFASLQPQNVRLRHAIRNLDSVAGHADFPLLFDPQTAGGLLASVPAGMAEACITELVAAGYRRAAIVGRVTARSDSPEPIVIAARSAVAG